MTAFKRAGRGAGAVAAIPIAQSSKRRLRGAWHRIMEVMLGDEVQRAAKAHCHQSFANVPIRLAAFRAAPESVQIVARMMLRERIERRASGNAAPATTALVATFATAATLIGAPFLGLLNAYFGQVGAGLQPTAASVTSMMQATAGPVSLVALVLVAIGLRVGYRARARDRERAMSAAWLSLYEAPAVMNRYRRSAPTSRLDFPGRTEAEDTLGIAATDLSNLFDLERFVIGGELAEAGELLLGPWDSLSSARYHFTRLDAGHRPRSTWQTPPPLAPPWTP